MLPLSTMAQPCWHTHLQPEESALLFWAVAQLRFATGKPGVARPSPRALRLCAGQSLVSLRGHASLPAGRSAREFILAIRVGFLGMEVLALGPRQAFTRRWRRSTFSEPAYMQDCPLGADAAFGGTCAQQVYYPNPGGLGFALQGAASLAQGIALPRLENPQRRLSPKEWPLRRGSDWPALPMPWYPDGGSFEQHPLRSPLPLPAAALCTLESALGEHPRWQWELPAWRPVAALVEDGFGRTAEMSLRCLDMHLDSGIATLAYGARFAVPGRDYLATLRELKAGVVP